jgi:glycosyltransferase involved in cell wall biosynthesis
VKVIVNATGYVGQAGGAGGAGVFLQYLVSELAKTHAVDVLIAPNSRNFANPRRDARFIELPYLAGETLRHLRDGPTVVIDPFGALPCAPFPDDIALCVVVHDLMHLERPYFFTATERKERSVSFANGLQRADAVVTFSADQARAIRRFFPAIAPVVIPHLPYAGLKERLSGSPEFDATAFDPFLLLPSVKWPHKNHSTVIAAFGAYVGQTGSKLQLVLCGGPCAESRFSFYPSQELISNQVSDLGLVSDTVLRGLFSAASALVFPSLYEGFGIPVIEAAYLGKMIVASRLNVFDEILGAQGYRSVEEPLCQLRWMDGFADVESPVRSDYEARTRIVRERVDPPRFTTQFTNVLKSIADRYSHPALYPIRAFQSGDRPTSSLVSSLVFADIHGTADVERGSRQIALGGKTQTSVLFRSSGASPDRKVCLRAQYNLPSLINPTETSLVFSAWVRLVTEPHVEAITWSVNDGDVLDLMQELRDGDWHLVRRNVPAGGFVDFRATSNGVTEIPGFDIEIHDPCLLSLAAMPPPVADTAAHGLSVYVAALSEATQLRIIINTVSDLNAALPTAETRLHWVIITTLDAIDDESARDLPANVRVQIVAKPFERAKATSLASPYQPLDQLLLLDATDLTYCLDDGNLKILAAALVGVGVAGTWGLSLHGGQSNFWSDDERGQIMSVGHRIGQPLPFFDHEVIRGCLAVKAHKSRPRFAVIETDRTGNISHHGVVSRLFLDGAEACGFQPILGLNRGADAAGDNDIEVWAGFDPQVYAPGSADGFEQDVTAFARAQKLGPNDLIFMHSLSPHIVLGAARFVAANGANSPRFAMRFFSTAEAMAGHNLSYTKILKSIEAVQTVRDKMHFFCESENLISYYEKAIGHRYPLLLNPEPPSLAAVRNSDWFDPNLGGGRRPILAYFGEARAEKGFGFIPGILDDLLADPAMTAFEFLVQTGSNSGNQTPEMAQAKMALFALKEKHPGRIRTFESAATSEEFYFLMKHTCGVIAPYLPEAYGIRGTGVTLEALQMGLNVFAWIDTDLYATFQHTGRVIGVGKSEKFAEAIARHYRAPKARTDAGLDALRQTPAAVCERMISLCVPPSGAVTRRTGPPVLWVGNDTFGEGNSFVYASQKRALKEIGRDCLELYVPWPDRNWHGVGRDAYDAKIYGFDSQYEGNGLAWVATPNFSPELDAILHAVESDGATYVRLRDVSKHMEVPESLARALRANQVEQTVLNYAHLHPTIAKTMPLERVICETHDIISYQYAVRRDTAVSLTEKIDEFSDLAQFPQIVAISIAEQREMERACPGSEVFWRLPPYIPEEPIVRAATALDYGKEPVTLGDIPDVIAYPSPLMLSIYQSRPDLQQAFDLHTHFGRMQFFRWSVFTGQFEAGGRFVFTKRQYDWLIEESLQTGPFAGLSGLLLLILSVRDDVRATYSTSKGIKVAALKAWAKEHAEREFGFYRDSLITQGDRHFARRMTSDDPTNMSALDAVVAAQPIGMSGTAAEQQALFERIGEIGKVDLVLIGSGHPANIASFEWFINKVYLTHLAPTGRSLFIIGSACDHLGHHVHRNLALLGRCRRIEPFLHASRACPLPVIAGSGSSIKTIPAMAVNGAVTVTDRIEHSFGLANYGIPAFSDPKAFADDLHGLFTDESFRDERVRAARRYVDEQLTLSGYVEFWRQRLKTIETAVAGVARADPPARTALGSVSASGHPAGR